MTKNILKFFRQNFSLFSQNVLIMFISVTGAVLMNTVLTAFKTYAADAPESGSLLNMVNVFLILIIFCAAATIASIFCNKGLFWQNRKNFAVQKIMGVRNVSAYAMIFSQLFIPALIGFIAGVLTGLAGTELLKNYFFEPAGIKTNLYFYTLLPAACIPLLSTIFSFLYGAFILHWGSPVQTIEETASFGRIKKELHLGRSSKKTFAFTIRTGTNHPVLLSIFLAAVLTTLLTNITATVEMQSTQKIGEFRHITLLQPKNLGSERKISQIMSRYNISWLAAEYQIQEENILFGTQKKYIFHANDAATRNKLRTIENLKLFSVMDNPIPAVIITVDDYKKLKESDIDLSEDFEQIVDYDFLVGQTACTAYFLSLIKFLLLSLLFFILFSFIIFSSAHTCRMRLGELSVMRVLGISSAKILRDTALEVSFFMILFSVGGSLSASIGWSILSNIILGERFTFYIDIAGILKIFSIGFLSYMTPLSMFFLRNDLPSMLEKCNRL